MQTPERSLEEAAVLREAEILSLTAKLYRAQLKALRARLGEAYRRQRDYLTATKQWSQFPRLWLRAAGAYCSYYVIRFTFCVGRSIHTTAGIRP